METINEAQWKEITICEIQQGCKKLANWKAPGLDQVQNFWLKYLTSLQPKLTELMNKTIKNPTELPTWMTKGRTTLIHKKGPTSMAKNYQPITCLPTYYKLATLILTDRIYEHVTTNEILPVEQKGPRRKARGCKDHLLLDKIITEDAIKKKRNISMMWIDYKKAYDSIPHTWLTRMLQLYKVDNTTRNFIASSIPTW